MNTTHTQDGHHTPPAQRSPRLGSYVASLAAAAMLVATIGGARASAQGSTEGRVAASRSALPSGGTVTMPIVADPTFNPWYPGVGIESVFPDRVLFDGLTKPGLNGLPAPDLATRWQVARDGLTWTFALRHGVTWHVGNAFTSPEVVYTFE